MNEFYAPHEHPVPHSKAVTCWACQPTYTDDDVTAAIDAIDDAHETTYHIHASECCMVTGKYAEAILDAVAPMIAARAEVRGITKALARADRYDERKP